MYNIDLPTQFTGPDPFDLKYIIPSNIDPSTISYVGEFLPVIPTIPLSNPRTTARSKDDGSPVGLLSVDINLADDQGWATLDTVFIRLETHYTPSGHFPVYSDLPSHRTIGYDAAVCVQKYESWIIETYNASITSPSLFQIIGKGNWSTPLLPSGSIRGTPIADTRYLNMTGKRNVFSYANRDAVNRMGNDINTEESYNPNDAVSPTMLPPTAFFLTSAYSADRVSRGEHWTAWIH